MYGKKYGKKVRKTNVREKNTEKKYGEKRKEKVRTS
jgi:hypothetical protein